MRYAVALLVGLWLIGAQTAAAEAPPIKELGGIAAQESVFEASSATKPLVITSAKEAAEHFSKEELDKLGKAVDFTNQVVLVFAWRGSGGDRLSYAVAESYPEQVVFNLKRGLTRDLRPHVYIYALRNNVKWTAP